MFEDMRMNNNILYEPYEGYMRGNMFKDLYKGYKDYKVSRLIPNNEQAELLLNLNQISFENQDIRLHLDIYPNDKEMLDRYNMNTIKIKELMNDYENRFGPIACDSLSSSESFSWEEYEFPWEVGEK